MYQLEVGDVVGYKGRNVSYQMIKQNESKRKLSIILPGADYNTDKPLLHYATSIALENGYDVLRINYDYNDEIFDEMSNEEFYHYVKNDSLIVIEALVKPTSHEEVNLIGKSIGTVAMSHILKHINLPIKGCVWLTPLMKMHEVYIGLSHNEYLSLMVIGDKDRHYLPDQYAALIHKENVTGMLVTGANHSLEIPNHTALSINYLNAIMIEIDNLLKCK
jgi:poly(3-hydroxyalkanoate) synthetase